MENISSTASDLDLGWEQTERVALPGFGFFPSRVVQILENITAVKYYTKGGADKGMTTVTLLGLL